MPTLTGSTKVYSFDERSLSGSEHFWSNPSTGLADPLLQLVSVSWSCGVNLFFKITSNEKIQNGQVGRPSWRVYWATPPNPSTRKHSIEHRSCIPCPCIRVRVHRLAGTTCHLRLQEAHRQGDRTGLLLKILRNAFH